MSSCVHAAANATACATVVPSSPCCGQDTACRALGDLEQRFSVSGPFLPAPGCSVRAGDGRDSRAVGAENQGVQGMKGWELPTWSLIHAVAASPQPRVGILPCTGKDPSSAGIVRQPGVVVAVCKRLMERPCPCSSAPGAWGGVAAGGRVGHRAVISTSRLPSSPAQHCKWMHMISAVLIIILSVRVDSKLFFY